MRFIKINQKETKDHVETESLILKLLKSDQESKKYSYECADFNWANYINNYG